MAWTAEQRRKHADGMRKYWAYRKAGKSTSKTTSATTGAGTSSGGKHRCPQCGKTFGMAAHLGRHMTTMHAKAKSQPAASTRGSMSADQRKAMGRKMRAAWKRRKVAASSGGGDYSRMSIEALIATRRQINQDLADRLVRGLA